jgi:hypothetical protein
VLGVRRCDGEEELEIIRYWGGRQRDRIWSFNDGEVLGRAVIEVAVLCRIDAGRSLVRLSRKDSSPMVAIYSSSDRDRDGSCRRMGRRWQSRE